MSRNANHDWYKDAVFYEVYLRAFCDGDGDGHGDFKGLTSKLDYLQELGIDCIWLMPMYKSPHLDSGYDIADYYALEERYGTLDDFRETLEAAHQRGIRVIVDLVMNHTSDQHPWFRESRSSKDNPRRDYYVWSETDQKYREVRIIFVDSQESNWEYDPSTGEYYFHRFFPHQPDLNFDHPEVQQAMLNVMKYWLDMGIDGFRADAVPYLFEREGTSCENLPETHEYLKRVRKFMDDNYENKILLAEANQWPEDVRAYFGDGDEFHMCFHFPVMPRIFMALKKEDRTPIVDILARTPSIPDSCQWCTFLRCHDELTLEMVTEEDRRYMWDRYACDPRMRLNLGIRRRLAPLLDNDQRRIELANSILFTLPGSPVIYYGDEMGMGDLYLKDRDGLRTPMQWSAEKNGGFSTAAPSDLYLPIIEDEVFGYRRVNVQAQRADPASLLNATKKLIRCRKQHKVFGRGTCQFLHPDNAAVLAYVRRYKREQIVVVNNLSAARQSVFLALAEFAGASPMDIASGQDFPAITESYQLHLEPYQYLWLLLG